MLVRSSAAATLEDAWAMHVFDLSLFLFLVLLVQKKRVRSVLPKITTALSSGVLLVAQVWGLSCGVWTEVGCPLPVPEQPLPPGPHVLGQEKPLTASRRRHLEGDHH